MARLTNEEKRLATVAINAEGDLGLIFVDGHGKVISAALKTIGNVTRVNRFTGEVKVRVGKGIKIYKFQGRE